MKTLFLITLTVTLSSCSMGLRPRASQIEKMAMLANAEIAFKVSPTVENSIALGLALANYGRHEAAIERYEQAAAMSKGGVAALAQLCVENNILARWNEAISNCEKALALQPGHALARNGLRYAQRAKQVEETLSKDGSAQINLGMEHYSKGEWAMAVAVWSEIPAGSPSFSKARSNMASAFILMKDFKSARTLIDEALRLEPGNELFRNNAKWLEREVVAAKGKSK